MAITARKQRHVRISEESHRVLQELTASSGMSMTAVIDRAIDQYRREQVFAEVAIAWATMEDDLMADHLELEGTIADGLEHDTW